MRLGHSKNCAVFSRKGFPSCSLFRSCLFYCTETIVVHFKNLCNISDLSVSEDDDDADLDATYYPEQSDETYSGSSSIVLNPTLRRQRRNANN